jgi:molecular chaperone GrpE
MADEQTQTPTADGTEVEALRAKLDAAEKELHNYKLRLADFDNTRKRLLRDAENDRKYMAESLAKDVLPALDNLDRATEAAKKSGDAAALAAGVAATVSQFLDAFKRHGITRIEVAPGSAFDPNLHQAVMEQPSKDVPPGHVVQVLQQGFMIHDRVLRPASVIVASAGG